MPLLRNLIPPAGPVRVLCFSNLSKTVGNGILMSVTVLFFTRSVGIHAEQVGLALTVAAAFGILASVPAGHAADMLGPRNTTIAFMCLQGVLICGYALVGGFVGLLVAAVLVLVAESATDAARATLIAGVVPSGERVRAWAYLRSVSNVGVCIGAVAGGVALRVDTRAAYTGLLIAAGALLVVAGLAYLNVPQVPPAVRSAEGPRLVVLRDKPYAVISLLNAVLVMNGGILVVALPIWISQRTSAPTWVYSGLLVLNTVVVVLFQVRASKGSEDVPGGARALRRCGALLAGCCALFALAAGRPPWLAALVLVAGAFVHVLGELFYSAGSWALSYELAPDDAQGQYQGLFGMSTQLGSMVTPLAVTTLVIGWGWPGWLAFAAIMLAAGLAAPPAARWAQRTRPAKPAAEPATA
jgi:MFS family permease